MGTDQTSGSEDYRTHGGKNYGCSTQYAGNECLKNA